MSVTQNVIQILRREQYILTKQTKYFHRQTKKLQENKTNMKWTGSTYNSWPWKTKTVSMNYKMHHWKLFRFFRVNNKCKVITLCLVQGGQRQDTSLFEAGTMKTLVHIMNIIYYLKLLVGTMMLLLPRISILSMYSLSGFGIFIWSRYLPNTLQNVFFGTYLGTMFLVSCHLLYCWCEYIHVSVSTMVTVLDNF